MEDAIIPPPNILKQITQRQEAKKQKNYSLADQIQKDILSQGWILSDKQGVTQCKPKKRSNIRAVDNHRRQTTRKKQQYVRRKKTRFPIFADFIMDTFFDDDERNRSVIDVAGGKARLALEFTLERNVACTVVDPCTTRLSTFTTRRLVNLALESDNKTIETNNNITPSSPSKHNIAVSSIFHTEEIKRIEIHKNKTQLQQRTETFLQSKGFVIHKCLFNKDYIQNNPIWNEASVILGMHPDEATEDIVDLALEYGKSFAVVPCCVFPSLFPRKLKCGADVRSVDEFVKYLLEKDGGIRCSTLDDMEGNNVVVYKL